MLTRATAHGGCTDTVRESALKDDPGKERKKRRKKPKQLCRTGDSNSCQYCDWIFGPSLYPLSCPATLRNAFRISCFRARSRISGFRTTRRARAHFIDDEATTVLLNKTHFFLRDRPNTKHRKRTADFGDRQSFHNLKRATQQETQRRPEWTSAPSFSCGSPKPYTLEPSWLQGDTGQVKVLFTLYHDHVVEGHGCFKTLQNGAHVLLAFKLLLLFLFDC